MIRPVYRKVHLLVSASLLTACVTCTKENGTDELVPPSKADAVVYTDIHDPIGDEGQFFMPEDSRIPERYWVCVDMFDGGLPYQLLCESVSGLVNGAFQEGRSDVAVWLDVNSDSYNRARAFLGREVGRQTAFELCFNEYGPFDGAPVQVKDLFSGGYVLCDVATNPESSVVASVAAHVYQAVIVDVSLEERFIEAGYTMRYDARRKTTRDAWEEFRDACRNDALVLMPVNTAELRNFSICHHLFVLNLCRERDSVEGGMNSGLMDEVLAWLQPDSPVLGWEGGPFGEDEFVGKISRYGHLMLAADWSYNHSLTSAGARERQSMSLAPVIHPRTIDYHLKKNFISFVLTDGDNYQWVMGDGFEKDFYALPSRHDVRMSYTLGAQALAELSPDRYSYLVNLCGDDNTLMETFGGGYFYADTYAQKTSRRAASLAVIAARTGVHMRQHRIKVLQLIAWRALSQEAMEAYQAFVDANDQLEGIVVIQYSPYTGGDGEIRWCTNSQGYDIPVITARYVLWKGLPTSVGGGNPKEVSDKMKEREPSGAASFSLCSVHAWSDFAENRSSDAAASCLEQLPDRFQAVSAQELIWRVRMAYRPEQTRKYLSTIQ